MLKFIIKRTLTVIPMILAVIVIVFGIINITPGDPGRSVLGAAAAQEAVDAFNHSIGYDRPWIVRLGDYLKGIVMRFDFGSSYFSGRAVTELIGSNFIYTFRLTMIGVALYVAIGIPLGVLSAVKQYSAADNILRVLAMLISAFPGFWLSMLSVLVFSLWLGWLPSSGVDSWKSYILPVLTFIASYTASTMRMTRTYMLESIRQDYVRTARAKGASERTVIWTHAFRNSMLPIINTIGVMLAMLMGGTMIQEVIFSMPGLGSLSLTALQQKDVPVTMGVTIFLSAIFCLMMLVVDVVSALVDPRVRARYAG